VIRGIIRRLITDRGFVFIPTAESTGIFCHRGEIQGVEYGRLVVGQEAEFDMGRGRDGHSLTVSVRLAQPKD
jgi:cold shock CspA family protein